MQIHCPQCGRPLTAVELDLATRSTRCGDCHAAVRLPVHPEPRDPANRRPLLPGSTRWRGIRVHDDGLTRTLRFRWYTREAWLLLGFTIFWDGILTAWYALALGGDALWPIVFPLLHVGAGVAMTYQVLALFLNRTRIALRQGLLRVRHGPLPWLGRVRLDATRIRRLSLARNRGDKGGVSHTMTAVLDDGSRRVLLRGIPDHEQAMWIRWQLDTWLGQLRPSSAPGVQRLAG